MDFTVNGTEMGTHGSEVNLDTPSHVKVTVLAAAYLDPIPALSQSIRHFQSLSTPPVFLNRPVRSLPYYEKPYWDLERARIGDSRDVPVKLVVNGEPVARQNIVADGTVQKLNFDVPIHKSSWVAVRILPSSHTDPIFVIVGGKPIRASLRSAEWCLAGVNQCWLQKAPLISKDELPAAQKAYDHARAVYRQIIAQWSK